ncbi:MAG: malate synthase A, partial [Gammaproteobacteria bacterium]|nr:malate synthase A [Gammaproteobacteria bacterium]
MSMSSPISSGPTLLAKVSAEHARILTPDALDFVAGLARAFEPARQQLLVRRAQRQDELDRGMKPDFLPETRAVCEADWTIAPVPAELADRRVEITGPV